MRFKNTSPRITESHKVQYIFRLLYVLCLKGDTVKSSEDDVVDQGHFGCISRRAGHWLPLLQPFSIVSLHVLVYFTFRAALGVESSLYGPSAHFLFDIVKLKDVGIEEEEHNLEERECTQTLRGHWCCPPMFQMVGGRGVSSDLWSDALILWKLHASCT